MHRACACTPVQFMKANVRMQRVDLTYLRSNAQPPCAPRCHAQTWQRRQTCWPQPRCALLLTALSACTRTCSLSATNRSPSPPLEQSFLRCILVFRTRRARSGGSSCCCWQRNVLTYICMYHGLTNLDDELDSGVVCVQMLKSNHVCECSSHDRIVGELHY